MIQNIYPHKLYNEYRADACLKESSPLLIFNSQCIRNGMPKTSASDSHILVKLEEEKLVFPTLSDIRKVVSENTEYLLEEICNLKDRSCQNADKPENGFVYAFAIDDAEFFLYIGEERYEIEGFEYLDIRKIRKKFSNIYGMIAFTGKHLNQWYRQSRFCGICGEKTIHSIRERAMVCSECKEKIYPRLTPAVIVGVIKGDELLLTKYKEGFNYYALIAGFTEIGETLEETVAREVMEEAGIKVKNIQYYKSQPWGIVQDLLVGFFCEVDGDSTITMDENELKLAAWVSREDIELQPDSYSLTNEMMGMFKNNMIAPDRQ